MKIYLIADKQTLKSIEYELQKYGDVVVINKGKDLLNYSEILKDKNEKVIGVDPGILEWKFPLDYLKQISKLKGICTKSSWAYYIDVDYCSKKNIIVCNCAGANSQSVAEYAIWMMFSLARKLPMQLEEGFNVAYDDVHAGNEVSGKTAGIVGLGNIGSKIAKMAAGIGMNVTYWSRNKKNVQFTFSTLENVLSQSDFVFNCLETCEGTHGILNSDHLSLMKESSYFISVLGGMGFGVEDDDYLLEMTKQCKLAGFAIENEHQHNTNYPKRSLVNNVFIPGAYAWFTKESLSRTQGVFIDGIKGIITGKVINQIQPK